LTEISVPTPPAALTTPWNKALDFSGSSQRIQQVDAGNNFAPLKMGGLSTTAGLPSTVGQTSNSTSARPWATSIVFTSDNNASNQHIWNMGEGAGDSDDNIYLRVDASRNLYFGWGRNGALNEILITTLATGTGNWYGVYIASTGTRLSGSNATANMLAGFYAIINAMNGNFYVAAAAVFVAMVLDGLDGRVARLTNTQSAFGAEYDSLSDMVAFGVAPALLAFEWALGSMGKVGWMVAFIYVAGAALRLARFNTQIGSTDKRYFIGLASPAAAGVVAGTVWAFSDFGIKGSNMAFAVAILVAAAGVLMVSNIKYHSFKDLDLKGRVPFVAILVVVLVFAVVFSDPPRVLLIIFLAYAASGPVQYLLQLRRRKSVE